MVRGWRQGWLLAAGLSLVAHMAAAEAPSRALRPEARPAAASSQQQRPSAAAAIVGQPVVMGEARGAVTRAVRPPLRPNNRTAAPAARVASGGGGGLCGNPALSGREIGRVSGRGGCGINNGVELTAVHGIALSPRLTVSCDAANAFASWVANGAIPAIGETGGGIRRFDVGGYACRPRNNQSGNQLSEHGKGNAVDVMGLRLRDGTNVTLLNSWNARRWSRPLRQMHRAACGTFGTVLGPESNRFHRDHFHFDTARHRAGAYCR